MRRENPIDRLAESLRTSQTAVLNVYIEFGKPWKCRPQFKNNAIRAHAMAICTIIGARLPANSSLYYLRHLFRCEQCSKRCERDAVSSFGSQVGSNGSHDAIYLRTVYLFSHAMYRKARFCRTRDKKRRFPLHLCEAGSAPNELQ